MSRALSRGYGLLILSLADQGGVRHRLAVDAPNRIKRPAGFRQSRVQLQGLLRSGLRLWQNLVGRQGPDIDELQLGYRETRVRLGKVWLSTDRLFEILDRPDEALIAQLALLGQAVE